jgi:HEAT repeat protein
MLGSDEGYVLGIEGTRSAEPRERYKAAFALGAMGRADANDELAPLLKDPDPEVRLAAATAILELR